MQLKSFSFFMGFFLVMIISSSFAFAEEKSLISLFPLVNYDQTISKWINPDSDHYNEPLLSEAVQKQYVENFYAHYFGELSPWNANNVTKALRSSGKNSIKSVEKSILSWYDNSTKAPGSRWIGYKENFRPYTADWTLSLENNIELAALDNLSYQTGNRGIAIDNLAARALPTEDVLFYSHKLAGEGYPFDNLQMSSLWAGTPVYIVKETKDHAWSLVISPDYIAWVKTNGIARVDDGFVRAWSNAAEAKLMAITTTKTPIVTEEGQFLFSGYVGSVFPAGDEDSSILVLVANEAHHAIIKSAKLSSQQVVKMPLAATPQHFAMTMATMIGRPYGWGGMYFYNDCSAETKSLFTPLGIWLPRHSSEQVNVGKLEDMTTLNTAEQRISYLRQHGKPFLTLIYIGNHVILYIGNYPNPHSKTHELMAMTYQNVWGLTLPDKELGRFVIGQAVLFPLLTTYPENKNLVSLANKDYFKISYLDQISQANFLLKRQSAIDVPALMYPEALWEKEMHKN